MKVSTRFRLFTRCFFFLLLSKTAEKLKKILLSHSVNGNSEQRISHGLDKTILIERNVTISMQQTDKILIFSVHSNVLMSIRLLSFV